MLTPSYIWAFVWDSGLKPLRRAFDQIQIQNAQAAHLICQIIPNQCPFARDIRFFGHLLFRIPPLCKLNPFYDQIMGLKFRAMAYLVEQGEDITAYCV